jgi:PleD family two-component response regulator
MAIKKTILVVDDDRFYGNICKVKLTKEGFNVVVMTNGAWAIKAVAASKPDLILLDLVMPEMDGFETLKALKSDSTSKNIPVIALTNLGQPEDVKKAMSLGAVDYMIKTVITIQKMVEKVRSHLL